VFFHMRIQNRYKGFASFDAILSIIPIVLMLVFLLDVSVFTVKNAGERMHRQQVFDKLVSVADYTVKIGTVKRENGIRYPNWLETKKITNNYVEDLRVRTGLPDLYRPGHG